MESLSGDWPRSAAGASRAEQFSIRPMRRCPRITPVEDKLLEALTAAAAGDLGLTQIRLRQIMPATAARLATPHPMKFARSIADAGLDWPTPHADAPCRTAADWRGGKPADFTRLH